MDGITNGTLVTVHDGSYMEKLDPSVCSAAVVLHCTKAKCTRIITAVERTDPFTASNFRGEGIGGVLNAGLIYALHQCMGEEMSSVSSVRMGCDNMGIVRHGNDFKR